MTKLRGLVFDKDGTLFDFTATWAAWTEGMIARESGGDPRVAQALAAALGFDPAARGFLPGSPVVTHTSGEVVAAMLPHLPGTNYAALLDRADAAAAALRPLPAADLRPLLTGFRAQGLRLGVATNDSERAARAHLDAAGVTDLFDMILGFDSGHGGKPAPGQLLAFAKAMGLAPGQVGMVGDSLHDLHAAQAAGMVPLAVLTGTAGAATLAPAAAAVLPSIADLPGWLAEQAA